MLTVPERAIACFERFSHTKVSCYPKSLIFWAALNWRIHDFRPCIEMKCSTFMTCQNFDCYNARRDAWRYPNGGIKICHAGLFEWFVPVMYEKMVVCYLTAGLRLPPRNLPSDIPLITLPKLSTPSGIEEVPMATEDEVREVMELLRMLGSRLECWHDKMLKIDFRESDMPRAEVIRCLIAREACNNPKLADLAKLMNLSPSRTAHLVKEETGESLSDLLRHSKNQMAVTLLRDTNLSISEIAGRCGFGSTSQFHRLFRREFGSSPLVFRKQRQGYTFQP